MSYTAQEVTECMAKAWLSSVSIDNNVNCRIFHPALHCDEVFVRFKYALICTTSGQRNTGMPSAGCLRVHIAGT